MKDHPIVCSVIPITERIFLLLVSTQAHIKKSKYHINFNPEPISQRPKICIFDKSECQKNRERESR